MRDAVSKMAYMMSEVAGQDEEYYFRYCVAMTDGQWSPVERIVGSGEGGEDTL